MGSLDDIEKRINDRMREIDRMVSGTPGVDAAPTADSGASSAPQHSRGLGNVGPAGLPSSPDAPVPSQAGGASKAIGGNIADLAGVERLKGFDLGRFVSDVFRRHSQNEVESYFTVGTPETVPNIAAVDDSWPRPWLFTRLLAAAVALYFLFDCAFRWFSNANLIPGLIVTGTIAIPFSTLVFFIEVNVRRNVSLYQVMRHVLFGGLISLVFSLILFSLPLASMLSWMGASVAGIVEEAGKLAAVVVVTSAARYRYKLNGLLFGAAVGTGFAVFESMGYAFRVLLSNGVDGMESTIILRGVLSPFGHIVWTAITAAALWRVRGGAKFSFSHICNLRFLRLFCIPVVLHMIWNANFSLPFMAKYFLLGAVAWIVVLALIQEGLGEIRDEKNGKA